MLFWWFFAENHISAGPQKKQNVIDARKNLKIKDINIMNDVSEVWGRNLWWRY